MSGAGWQPAPEGFRPVQHNPDGTQRGSLDRAEAARAARQKERAKARKQVETQTSSLIEGRPGSEAPADIIDGILLALRAEPHHLHSADSHGTLTMDTPGAKRARERARLDAQQEAAAVAIKQAVEKKKDGEDENSGFDFSTYEDAPEAELNALFAEDDEADVLISEGANDDFSYIFENTGTEEN
jgi:hypothetical protein